MNSALVLMLLVAVLPAVAGYYCSTMSCKEQTCREVTEENCQGRIARNSSPCGGCCDICMTILEPGARCTGPDFYINYLYSECTEGYSCDFADTEVCRPISEISQ